MKIIAILLLIASVALNVGFLTGCQTLHDAFYGDPCKYSQSPVQPVNDGGKAELVRIAGMLDIKTSGKAASDLLTDICYKLEGSADVPTVFDDADFDKMEKDLNPIEKKAMRAYQDFISGLQGKKVIVIEPGK